MDKIKLKLEYQKKHPNCKNCIWYKYVNCLLKYGISAPDYIKCDLKNNAIYFPSIKAKFCKYYKVRGDKDEI